MQTQYIRDTSLGTPWLERYSEEAGGPVRTYLEKFPFTIGRNESADLQIESNRVSREHAVIIEKSKGNYCLRDLKSTNGTFVNGQRIQEIELQDGDLVAVANFELIFSSNQGSTQPYAMTQMMTEGGCDGTSEKHAAEILQNLRLSNETLLEGVGEVRFDPIFDLRDCTIQGYEAKISHEESQLLGANTRRMILDLDCRLALRMRHVDRLLALEEAMQLPHDGPILFRLTDAESAADMFSASLCALEHLTDDTHRVVLAIPYASAKTDPDFREKIRLRTRCRHSGGCLRFSPRRERSPFPRAGCAGMGAI